MALSCFFIPLLRRNLNWIVKALAHPGSLVGYEIERPPIYYHSINSRSNHHHTKLGKKQADPVNYRPITLLSSIAKVFEIIILANLKSKTEHLILEE